MSDLPEMSALPGDARIGFVVIGRNEGERLKACLASIDCRANPVVYVDSGSTDGSPALAASFGCSVVDLDLSRPFTAGRARNAGFERLQEAAGEFDFVQFVDGDCVLEPDWVETARAFLDSRPDVAIVCGRRRERHPETSVFNLLCDVEWNTPVGEAGECGGDFLARKAAFAQVGGFTPDLIAGEEPDLCARMRRRGWKIWRLGADMTRHDAAMTRLGQWWRRTVRSGYAFADVSRRHRTTSLPLWPERERRALIWGGCIPLALIVGALAIHPAVLLGFAVYPLQVARIARRMRPSDRSAWLYAAFTVGGKIPELQGVAKFHWNAWRGNTQTIIEYK